MATFDYWREDEDLDENESNPPSRGTAKKKSEQNSIFSGPWVDAALPLLEP